jgi:hypothetical protein
MSKETDKTIPYLKQVQKARELFSYLEDLDGCGLVTTDSDLLAQSVADRFGVEASEAYDAYQWPEEAEPYKDWPRVDVTLHGWARVNLSEVPDEDISLDLLHQADGLVKWVIVPSLDVLDKWINDNGLASVVQTTRHLVEHSVAFCPADGVNLIIDADGKIVAGNPNAAAMWKFEALTFGEACYAEGIVPIYENHYRCEPCNEEWTDTWAGQPDDACPKCDKEYTPHRSDNVMGFYEEAANGSERGGADGS